MSDITRNLSYDDIKMLKKNNSGKSKRYIEENQINEQKEIE